MTWEEKQLYSQEPLQCGLSRRKTSMSEVAREFPVMKLMNVMDLLSVPVVD